MNRKVIIGFLAFALFIGLIVWLLEGVGGGFTWGAVLLKL